MKARAASPQSSTLQQDCRARCLSTHTFFACMRSCLCVCVCVEYYGMVWPFCFYGNGNLTHSASLINYAAFFFGDGAALVFAHAGHAHAQHAQTHAHSTAQHHCRLSKHSSRLFRFCLYAATPAAAEPEPCSVYFSSITKDVREKIIKGGGREKKRNNLQVRSLPAAG